MIPVRLARRLYDEAAEPKQLAVIAGGDHEDSAEVNTARTPQADQIVRLTRFA